MMRPEQTVPCNLIDTASMSPTLSLQYSKCGQTAVRLKALDKYNDVLLGSFNDTSANSTCALRYSNPQYFISEWAAKEETKLMEDEIAKTKAKEKRKKERGKSLPKPAPPLPQSVSLTLPPPPAPAAAPPPTEIIEEDLPPAMPPPSVPQNVPSLEDLSLDTPPPTPPPKPPTPAKSPSVPAPPTKSPYAPAPPVKSPSVPAPPTKSPSAPAPPTPPQKGASVLAKPPGKIKASAAIEGLLGSKASASEPPPKPSSSSSPSPQKVKASAALEGLFAGRSAAFKTSVASARVGRGALSIESSICVAVTQNLPARLHFPMIMLCSAMSRKLASTG